MTHTINWGQLMGGLVMWFAYYCFRDNMKLTGQSWVLFLLLLPLDLSFYYPAKMILAVVGTPNVRTVVAIMEWIGSVTLMVTGGLIRGTAAAPRQIRLLNKGFAVAQADVINCEYCESPMSTMVQRTCNVCGRSFVDNVMTRCRCGAPESALKWINCPTCGCSNDLR